MWWSPGAENALAPKKEAEKDPAEGLSGIFDQKCPACGVTGAYIGFRTVECHNCHCPHWSARWHADYKKLLSEALEKQKTLAAKTQKEAQSLLSEEFGLEWSDSEETTQDLDLTPFFSYPIT